MPETVKVDTKNASLHPATELLHPRPDPLVILRLLNEWMQGEEQEQKDTFQFLRQALDENRPQGAKLFP